MALPAVEISALYKSFGSRAVFENAGVRVETGSVFGLVGLNGSGKTTLIRILLGLLRPDKGAARVLGLNPWLHKPDFYRRIGVILEHDGFAPNLTVARNLRLFAGAKGIPWPRVERYVDEVWAGTFIHAEVRGGSAKVKHLSRGQKMQCAICRAFLGEPEAFFFDEPTVALDVDAIDHFYGLVRQAAARGVTVVISSHQLPAVEELCDRVGMLHDGKISILTSETGGTRSAPWLVRCQDKREFGAIIEQIVGFPADYADGAWRFSAPQAQRLVPRIVSALAGAGCEIQEVRPDADAIKNRMRSVGRETQKRNES